MSIQTPHLDQLDQLDLQITKNLIHPSPSTPMTFSIWGTSNGIIVQNIFKTKTMIFINPIVDKDILKFDLCITSLEYTNKLVRRIPLVYSGLLLKTEHEKVGDIDRLQIEMKQDLVQENIVAVKISIKRKGQAQNKDTLSCLILDPEKLNQNQQPSHINLLRIKCNHSEISDFTWTNLASMTLTVLCSNQTLEIWNLHQQDFHKPTILLKLPLINQKRLPIETKFTSISFINSISAQSENTHEIISPNKYSLFLMDALGEVYSLFPFITPGTIIPEQQYDIIYNKADQTKEGEVLLNYLKGCKLEQSTDESSGVYIVYCEGTYMTQHLQLNQFFKNNIPSPKLQDHQRLLKQRKFSTLKLFQMTPSTVLVLQSVHWHNVQLNCIWIFLLTKQLSTRYQNQHHHSINNSRISTETFTENVIYPIAEIKNQKTNPVDDLKFVGLDVLQRKIKELYFIEGRGLYLIDLAAIWKFVQTNNLGALEGQNVFPISLIFQLPQNESIVALSLQEQAGCISFLRRSPLKLKFQIQPLKDINAFEQVQGIAKISNDLFKKINKIKSAQSTSIPTSTQEKSNQLNLSGQKIRQYQQKGIQEIKKDYNQYCDGIKNGIDQGMSKLKTSFEIMKKRLKQFNSIKDKRNQLNNLLTDVNAKNEQINRILFQQNNTNTQKPKQITEMEININSLNSLLETVKSKDLSITPESETKLSGVMNELLEKLKDIRKDMEDAKNKKKLLEQYSK